MVGLYYEDILRLFCLRMLSPSFCYWTHSPTLLCPCLRIYFFLISSWPW